MGFYGKVNHSDRVNFTFDKIYNSRKAMEYALEAGTDSIAIGRYVLVEYGMDVNSYIRVYSKNDIDNTTKKMYLYHLPSCLEKIKYLETKPADKTNRYWENGYAVKGDKVFILNQLLDQEFYECVSNKDGYALFDKVDKPANASGDYYTSYSDDIKKYGNSRGFDSTVWQKVYADGKEKYVMIAELNSVVPTFGLAVDAPSEEPMTPHFDEDSTSIYYRLHVQPNWGFRIKNDNSEYSTNGKAIYFNNKGFDKSAKSHVNKTNEITLTKAQSGALYNTHNENNPFETKPADDIQELSIILPELGNAVSDMWDIVYGYENNGTRTTNISWRENGTKRLVREDETGYLLDEEAVATLAGCINSTHDLMGKIIENKKGAEDTISATSASVDKIYYGDFRENKDGKTECGFYIKEACYEYIPSNEPSVTEIPNMTQFEKNKYYYTSDNNYYLETNDYVYGKNYFDIEVSEVLNLIDSYEPVKYYYLHEGNYLLENSKYPDETKTYCEINTDNITDITSNENHILFFKEREQIVDENGIRKGYFYYADNQYRPVVKESVFDSSLKYYWVEGYQIETLPGVDPNDPAQDTVGWIVTNDNIKYQVTFIEFNETKNYYYVDENNNYIKLLKENIDDNVVYKVFEQDAIKTVEGLFYEPNTYHYTTNGNDYFFAKEPNKIEEATYYKLSSTQMEVTFYQPNKYYYKDGDSYVIDTSSTMGDYSYYDYHPLYVIPDESNSTIFPDGSAWNPNLPVELAEQYGVKLGARKASWRWKQLSGFARSLNTIHGLIIKINNILKADDVETRDRTTVQGCINSMNDLLNKVDTLRPDCLIISDQYGRMTTMERKELFNGIDSENPEDSDKWINLSVDDNGKINVNHIGPVLVDALNKENLTPAFGETFEIEDWVFDEKGHKANVSTHTVTIPQGSLNAEDPSGSDVISQIEFTPESGEIKTIRADISGITLNGYASTADNADIASTDTLGLALGKLQTQIIEEETARANAINDLNTSIATQFKTFEDEDNAIKDLINSIIEEFEDKFEEIGSNSSSTTERIDGEIGAIDSRIATLEANAPTWTAAAEKHADYDSTFSTLNQNYENLEEDVRNLEEELSEAKTLISSYEGQIASLQGEINALNGIVSQLIDRISALEEVEIPEEPEQPENPEEPEQPEES